MELPFKHRFTVPPPAAAKHFAERLPREAQDFHIGQSEALPNGEV